MKKDLDGTKNLAFRQSINFKIGISFFLLFALLSSVVAQVLFTLQKNNKQAEGINLAGRQRMLLQKMEHALHEVAWLVAIKGNKKDILESIKELEEARTLWRKSQDILEKGGLLTEYDKNLELPSQKNSITAPFFKKINELWEVYNKNIQTFEEEVSKEGRNDKNVYELVSRATKEEPLIFEQANNLAGHLSQGLGQTLVSLSNLLFGFLILMALLLLEGFLYLRKSFVSPVVLTSHLASSIGEGKLKTAGKLVREVNFQRKDEIGILGKGMEEMVEVLSQVFEEVVSVSNQLGVASNEMVATSTQQERSISEISTSVSEVTGSIQEMNVSSRETDERAGSMLQSSRKSREIALAAQGAVEQTLQGMEKIKERVQEIALKILELSDQSQKIGKITGTIEDIASQTNMLALNASIEAARAGEQGKGFAVVATQVRDLAQKSALATREIGDLIQEIQRATNSTVMTTEQGSKGVEEGVFLVQKTYESFQQILKSTEDVEEKSEEIRLASNQQNSATEQITEAITGINDVMTQAVASTNQVQETIQALNDMSRKLIGSVEKFKE